MCGVAGLIRLDGGPADAALVEAMTDTLAHRGPDGRGVFADRMAALGHRRLAIVGLGPAGAQPMTTPRGHHTISYNGELYNFRQLRAELEALGESFSSTTDTEVLLRAWAVWGPAVVTRLNGMFAFALWDATTDTLTLVRDRFGVKPMYYCISESRLYFASEVKAILRALPRKPRLCPEALDQYLTFQNVLTDHTLFEGVRILQPGHTLTISLRGDRQPKIERYWDFDFAQPTLRASEADAADALFELFGQAVKRQLMSDVAIGSYLSGGLDSSAITAVARKSLGRMTTFTGGFDMTSASGLELGFDERAKAEVVANYLKTEHYEMVMHAGDMEHIMPELIWHLEDLRVGQCYPNFYMARLAGKFVKVVLSGAGGDELFAGYPWRYYPGLESANPGDFANEYYRFWQRLTPDEDKGRLFSTDVLRATRHRTTFDIFRDTLKGANLPFESRDDYVNASLYFELKTFLHGLLVVEDRVSMAHSLEARVPFLDNDLVDFACRLPLRTKLAVKPATTVDENDIGKYRTQGRTSEGKLVLRAALRRLVPSEVTERAKQGFSAPDASWFRGESVDYVAALLEDPGARIYTYLRQDFVGQKLMEHRSGARNHRLYIWSLLCLEWWLRTFQ